MFLWNIGTTKTGFLRTKPYKCVLYDSKHISNKPFLLCPQLNDFTHDLVVGEFNVPDKPKFSIKLNKCF